MELHGGSALRAELPPHNLRGAAQLPRGGPSSAGRAPPSPGPRPDPPPQHPSVWLHTPCQPRRECHTLCSFLCSSCLLPYTDANVYRTTAKQGHTSGGRQTEHSTLSQRVLHRNVHQLVHVSTVVRFVACIWGIPHSDGRYQCVHRVFCIPPGLMFPRARQQPGADALRNRLRPGPHGRTHPAPCALPRLTGLFRVHRPSAHVLHCPRHGRVGPAFSPGGFAQRDAAQPSTRSLYVSRPESFKPHVKPGCGFSSTKTALQK